MKNNNYKRFLLMLSLSFVVMYLVMFFNVYKFDHIYFSLTRFYMTLLMVTPMALIMLTLMLHMYKKKTLNFIIILTSLIVFVFSLIGLRTQTPIKDIQYMKAMISHHSSAILTSENANLEDPDVKELANEIIETQKLEIELMEQYIEKIQN